VSLIIHLKAINSDLQIVQQKKINALAKNHTFALYISYQLLLSSFLEKMQPEAEIRDY